MLCTREVLPYSTFSSSPFSFFLSFHRAGIFRITRDYTDPKTNTSHWSCQMNWHAVAALPELPGSCATCLSPENPDDTDYCKCYEASQDKGATCAISGKDCTHCCEPPPPPPPTPQNDATLKSIALSAGSLV